MDEIVHVVGLGFDVVVVVVGLVDEVDSDHDVVDVVVGVMVVFVVDVDGDDDDDVDDHDDVAEVLEDVVDMKIQLCMGRLDHLSWSLRHLKRLFLREKKHEQKSNHFWCESDGDQ
jgi:hypothetical protein